MNQPSERLYTIPSSNVNTTIIFQFYVIFQCKGLAHFTQKLLLKRPEKARVLPDSSKVNTPLP